MHTKHYLWNITKEERECIVLYPLLGYFSIFIYSTIFFHCLSCLSTWLIYLTDKTDPTIYLKTPIIRFSIVKMSVFFLSIKQNSCSLSSVTTPITHSRRPVTVSVQRFKFPSYAIIIGGDQVRMCMRIHIYIYIYIYIYMYKYMGIFISDPSVNTSQYLRYLYLRSS